MQIYDKPLGWLTPYENNPRNNDEAVEPVANSISEFGFKVPIVATSDGEIINGNMSRACTDGKTGRLTILLTIVPYRQLSKKTKTT